MEPDDHHQTPEKSSGDEQGESEVKTRSYECSFCKRGFSNAQALGGHMNIHRKDKSKHKQTSTSSQTQPSLDIHHQKVPSLWQLMETKSGEEQSSYTNWPWKVTLTPQDDASSRDETDLIVPIRQLPLFADSPIICKETQKPDGQVLGETTSERGFPSSHQGSSSELDLELRLGPDSEDSSATTSTRKFF